MRNFQIYVTFVVVLAMFWKSVDMAFMRLRIINGETSFFDLSNQHQAKVVVDVVMTEVGDRVEDE
jgi:hypothetical protein